MGVSECRGEEVEKLDRVDKVEVEVEDQRDQKELRLPPSLSARREQWHRLVDILELNPQEQGIRNPTRSWDRLGVPVTVVYGYNATGKTLVIQQLFKQWKNGIDDTTGKTKEAENSANAKAVSVKRPRVAFLLNCHEIGSAKQLFNEAIQGLCPAHLLLKKKLPACDNIQSFINGLQSLMHIQGKAQGEGWGSGPTRMILALDRVDLLLERNLKASVEALLRIHDMVHLKIPLNIILLTRGISTDLEQILYEAVPVYIHFPLYSKEETIELLACQVQSRPVTKMHPKPVRVLITSIYEAFYRDCSILTELKFVLFRLFPKFENYMHALDEAQDSFQSRKFLKFIQPHFVLLLRNLYQRNMGYQCVGKKEQQKKIEWELPRKPKPSDDDLNEQQSIILVKDRLVSCSEEVLGRDWKAKVVDELDLHVKKWMKNEKGLAKNIANDARECMKAANTISPRLTPEQEVELEEEELEKEEENVKSSMVFTDVMVDRLKSFKKKYDLDAIHLSKQLLFLVLASYLASFNPVNTDLTLFSSTKSDQLSRRRRRRSTNPSNPSDQITLRSQRSRAPTAIRQQLIGPKVFSLQRLMAIFLTLRQEHDMEEEEESLFANVSCGTTAKAFHSLDDSIFSLIAQLVKMNLLSIVMGKEGELNEVGFRCHADYEYVTKVAEQLGIRIQQYLYQPQ